MKGERHGGLGEGSIQPTHCPGLGFRRDSVGSTPSASADEGGEGGGYGRSQPKTRCSGRYPLQGWRGGGVRVDPVDRRAMTDDQ